MKFKPQSEDIVKSKDFVYRCMGPNVVQQHKHFRRFFAVQNPIKKVPPRYIDPNWKVREWMDFIQATSVEAWIYVALRLVLTSRPFNSKVTMLTSCGSATNRRGEVSSAIHCVTMVTLLHFTFGTSPLPNTTPTKAFPPLLHARVLSLFDKLSQKFHRWWNG